MSLESILRIGRRIIPRTLFTAAQPIYHYLLALSGALAYGFPSRKLFVVLITGTKGKTTTAELVNAVLEGSGKKTALAGTLRFKIGETSKPNPYKMTIRGRWFLQRFLRDAVRAGCTHAVIEMTSEGAKQFRQKFLSVDAVVFLNISPEHIESHGSFENYLAAKLAIARTLAHSKKPHRIIVANSDDAHAQDFFTVARAEKVPFSIKQAENLSLTERGSSFSFDNTPITLSIPGEFNVRNALAALNLGKTLAIPGPLMAESLARITLVRGRMEYVDAGQPFSVIVDYAHTADSLENAYGAHRNARKICVLGSTGGGRDQWKRKEMGAVADKHCAEIILTNEDPYDEDPMQIVNAVKEGVTTKPCHIIMDRREAIREALKRAHTGDAVYITGKGTDPYIMEANGARTPWDDATVVREELKKLLGH
ncbi:MAG: hypothetical protein A2408_03820 [Candidatus Yonathbacteria bacterium RIFOXYC1_FULL_52_10]|uniref:UDP-N-acetylmuramoyl-L-alanyl-D-glutamate--2, 6-diaminopimelate ligase n=1 Tax=Candidatus Yonathbacteria bacterium RIFOXYD1_FULL_52_36 TaxID=1802730 RepID=A0A1G2SNI9_9BACT|nr:MAG: hypothetical protein A2408_03820 [Candidatus Yonathbacteria bacterium RIFOXYC1_FULL_52_10]OHA85951.1 MAG: hypothetical protein A2591_00070 [Candidatus Yonathbacteria bacterium RIFOXYD1_FULL_52_36]